MTRDYLVDVVDAGTCRHLTVWSRPRSPTYGGKRFGSRGRKRDVLLCGHKAERPILVVVCGECAGTDKIGHFFEEGFLYFRIMPDKGDRKFAIGFGKS